METYNYTYNDIEDEDYFKVIVTSNSDTSYYKEIFIDNIIKEIVKIKGIRLNSYGYVILRKKGYHPIQHLILKHTSNMSTVVDHKDGNILNNRRQNLRVLTQKDNANNRTKNSLCNTGIVGIARRSNGCYDYFRASVSDRVTVIKDSKAKSQTKRYTKQFNINKLGEKEAMTQATDWLSKKRTEFKYV